MSRNTAGAESGFGEMAMAETYAPTVTATEVVLPGKVEPSCLRLVQRALPPPAAGQALVRVESTAVSFAETAMRRGRYYGQPPFPFVPGFTATSLTNGKPSTPPDCEQPLGWSTGVHAPEVEPIECR